MSSHLYQTCQQLSVYLLAELSNCWEEVKETAGEKDKTGGAGRTIEEIQIWRDGEEERAVEEDDAGDIPTTTCS